MFFRLVPPFLLLASAMLAQTPAGTTLSNTSTPFTRSDKPYAVLRRGPVEAVIVTNEAVNDEVLPNHRAGYSGVAKLTHKKQKENLFVPIHSGLNFEHILDGTKIAV